MHTRVAIVTGASRGIGKRTALELAHRGYGIVASARALERDGRLPGSLAETRAEIEAAGARVVVARADMSRRDEASALVSTAVETFGRLDAVVNNAALTHGGNVPVTELEFEDWHAQFDTNLHGPLALIQAAVPHLSRARGVIVNLSSGAGDLKPAVEGPLLYSVGYAASKAALNRLANALAGELMALGIAIVNVDPGSVSTERLERRLDTLSPEHRARLVSMEVPAVAIGHLVSCGTALEWTGRLLRAADFVRSQGLGTAVPDSARI
ncbi:SDR family NAD(P)-dependent oxidoreductase [Streptomyces iranensis]|uniref:NAD(P)-dependent dehydrogenase (Short-subunit alcohol dehydrogenase family) n=1 Tax=Streptomyces iranensis TaxID=576784 RepID=A0A061A513_9ACTN|nr:SDR family NAD(P)-dependent oxidoreductase [Streptomyces iranensis]MBP2063506.1 NAD(P)-dependent dehydrogenase (short-subunit alcohol dehydrogenase family) [Streptomyces iranensis]CDR17918.1 short chain dehydrogenase [Streptomyces iranensis]